MKSIQKSMTLRALQAGLLASTLLSAPAFGARLAYEGFNYSEANGTSVAGLNGGTGWLDAFPAVTAGTHLLADGLTFTGLNQVGKSMNRLNGDLTTDGRDWALSVNTSATYWYSFLVKASGGPEGTFNLFQTTGSNQNGTGLEFRKAANGTDLEIRATGNGGFNVVRTVPPAQTHWVLGKVTNTGHTVWVYAEGEALPSVEPTTGGVTNFGAVLTGRKAAMNGRRFGSSNASSSITFDEVCVADSFADVFPPLPGAPTFTVSPLAAVEGQTLTFNWENIPVTATAIELDPDNIDVLGDTTAGAGTTDLPAPASNTTYELTYTVGGVPTTLTQNYTAVAPFLTISPSSGYLGDNLTLNWRIPAGSTGITLTPNTEGLDMDALTNALTGVGSTPIPIPAPSANTVYTITWTGLGNGATGVSQTFTLLPSFFNVTPDPVAEGSTLTLNWRVSPEWDNNATLENNEVRLQSSTVADFSVLEDDFTVSADSATGVGTTTLTAALGLNFFRLVYYIDDVAITIDDTITVFDPYFNNLVYTPTNTAVKEHLNFGEGFVAYTDRTHTLVSVPSVLVGGHYLQTRQGDKTNASLSVSFNADPGTTVFVLIDNRVGDGIGGTNPVSGSDNPPVASALPWLAANGFLDSGLDIGIDENNDGSINNTSSVFFRHVDSDPGTPDDLFNLGSLDTTSPTINDRSVYSVVITKPQVVPVSFHAFPGTFPFAAPVPADLFWTLPTDATSVSISPTVGSVSINANGQGSVTVNPTATTTYTLTASSVSLGPITRTATVNVTGTPPPSGFGTFITGDFGGNTVPALQQGPNDDPDGDGIDNLMEYAIAGGDPTRSTASPAVISGTLVTFNKNTAATGITYALEKSSTLANDWVPATPTTNDANVITYTLTPLSPTKEFVRLKVTQP